MTSVWLVNDMDERASTKNENKKPSGESSPFGFVSELSQLRSFLLSFARSLFERLLIWLVIGNLGAVALVFTTLAGGEGSKAELIQLQFPVFAFIIGGSLAFFGMAIIAIMSNGAAIALTAMIFKVRFYESRETILDDSVELAKTINDQGNTQEAKEILSNAIARHKELEAEFDKMNKLTKIANWQVILAFTPYVFAFLSGASFLLGLFLTTNVVLHIK